MNCYTKKMYKTDEPKVKSFFEQDNAQFSPQQNAYWRARKTNYTAVFYTTGKLLIQGSDVTDIANRFEENFGLNTQTTLALNIPQSGINATAADLPVKHIGTDESGKGDFFGPLVIASVLVDEKSTEILTKEGIKDCKKVEDKNINKLAAIVKNNCVFSIVTITPTKYNELYAKLKNLNHLLAWVHARAIENILEKADCDCALSDKFGDESLIKNALMKKGKDIRLEQRCKAESDIAVAAASIIARAQFLKIISEFSQKYNIEIPKGASDKVVQTAKIIKENYSKEELKNLVKMHFKTYSQI